MLKEKYLITATKLFATENRNLSWYYTISTLLIAIALLVATFMPVFFLLRFALSILAGLVVVRLFVIYHDYLHGAILRRSQLADVLFTIIGMYVLAPKTVWRRTHDYHHKNNCKLYKLCIGSYPVFSKVKFEKCSPKEKFNYLFVRHPLTIAFGYVFTFIYGMCVNPLMNGFFKHFDSFIALSIHFAVQVLVVWFWDLETLFYFSLLPHLVSGAIGSYLFYVQHNFPGVRFASDDDWTYESSALESSSHLVMGPLMNWATGNIGYHHIHHLNARIPFYKLPAAMGHFKELQTPKTITLKIEDIIACFKLKIWDAEQQKMTSV